MAGITVLDQNTINKIAAGEVIERPSSVVKELLENAIDARATAITVEIRDGGISFIRVTDNGCGIPKDEVSLAFLRHSTSKIKSVEDLFTVASLGFRGEALSSIAAVSQVELITKTPGQLFGVRYQIEGGRERSLEEIGAPDGTTFLVRNLFYNTPARQKFLKTAQTEGSHAASLVEKIAMSRPDISIRFIQNNQNKLHTSGNHNLRDIIYAVFGREIAANLLPVEFGEEIVQVKGFAGKPVIARSNRNFENYYINGRYIKSSLVAKAIEEAYRPFMMQHKYPFVLLHLTVEPEYLDVNVHPTKMELRFRDGERIYEAICQAISEALARKELIPQVSLNKNKREGKGSEKGQGRKNARPEPFETNRRNYYEQRNGGRGQAGERAAKEADGQPGRSLMSQAYGQPGGMSAGQAYGQSQGDPAGQANGRSGENPAGQANGRSGGNPAGQANGKSGENPARQADGRSGGNPAGQANGWSGGNPAGQADGRSGGNPAGQVNGRSGGNPAGQANGWSGGNPAGQANGRSGENPAEQADGQEKRSPAALGEESGKETDRQAQRIGRSGQNAGAGDLPRRPDSGEKIEKTDDYQFRPVYQTVAERGPEWPTRDGNAASSDDSKPRQLDLFEEKLLEPRNRIRHKLIGQLFDTYWLVEFGDHLYIIDQHAAHEKVLYEKTMATLKSRQYTSQMVNPPIILTLGSEEQVLLEKYMAYFEGIGFEMEPFGGKEYAVRAVPDNLFSIARKELLMEMLDSLSDDIFKGSPDIIYERVASMSCKAAVKGNNKLSFAEADHLIDQLLELANPYACPHGRPTIISMSRHELERKFKRIV